MNLRLENFENQLGLTRFGQHCDKQTHKCSTYFRFCLRVSTRTCLVEFKTDLLGENSITNEQFKMTTDSIEFFIPNKYLMSSKIDLLIQAYHKSNHNNLEEELSIINEWILPLKKNKQSLLLSQKLNEWNKFQSSNGNHLIQLSYQLRCSKSYFGSTCEQRQSECNLKCKNGGACILNEINRMPMCKCSSNDFEGDLCQIRVVHECRLNDACLNGASCLANGECLCAPGYTGNKCQTKRSSNQCGSVTCSNGGTCMIDNQNEYSCRCQPSFTGIYCEIARPSTLSVSSSSSTSKQDHQMTKEVYLSSKEICIIILLGIGLPVLIILIAVLMLRNTKNVNDEENLKKIDLENQQDDYQQNQQNKPSNFINNNLFDARKADLNDNKKICINTISGLLSSNCNNSGSTKTKLSNNYSNNLSEKKLDMHSNEAIKHQGSFV